jgi:hypothetical protein
MPDHRLCVKYFTLREEFYEIPDPFLSPELDRDGPAALFPPRSKAGLREPSGNGGSRFLFSGKGGRRGRAVSSSTKARSAGSSPAGLARPTRSGGNRC